MTELVERKLRKDIEDAILNVAARPPGLRGPWVMDEAWLQQAAKNIRKRRALAQQAKP